ncbi:hypothetical protein LSH36_977g00002 [Paralvinella palmiformis]|uniref:G-protein coupled receptors family 1 profile domain-containing protein n=1 Tax=Paralvinella palmiformis TaxID=53620 RepID=A0AAD9IXD7_9ANNE|nr:hypothetical protein LSH36_977g00002 [Paralvinella palmiformis]
MATADCRPDDVCYDGNLTLFVNVSLTNGTEPDDGLLMSAGGIQIWTIVFTTFYALICTVGTFGNGLVILVVARYAKMKTVTNMYILNLAVADLCFLVGLPFLIVTAIMRRWLFGYIMCKVFYILTSMNWFTSVFTLTVMSADRYLAVCHPVRSMRFRTPLFSRIVCVCVWFGSFLVMLPIILYATTIEQEGHVSCTIQWPGGQAISPDKAFIWYALLLGFAIPVALIIVFYALVVLRLKTVGPKKKSKEKKRTHRKVTKMVLTIIAVYVICWLPYWVFQITLTFLDADVPQWSIMMFQIFTLLSYANSLLNPLLYAFLSDNFRKSFIKAFHCANKREIGVDSPKRGVDSPKTGVDSPESSVDSLKADLSERGQLVTCLNTIGANSVLY